MVERYHCGAPGMVTAEVSNHTVLDHQTQALVASYPFPSLVGAGLPVPDGVFYDAWPVISLLPPVRRR